MAKKIEKQEFLQRFYRSYPDAKIELIEYTAISHPVKIKCLICKKELTRIKARQLLNGFDCCNAHSESRNEKIQRLYSNNKDYQYLKDINKDIAVIKHLICGTEMRRNKNSCLDNPFSCTYCNTMSKNNMLSIQKVQENINVLFQNTILVLEYNGMNNQSLFKCKKCNFIFKQKPVCLLQSRGCPQCDRWKSLGEKKISQLLQKRKIHFQEQFSVDELPKQRFDFAILNSKDKPIAFIEIQGEGHFFKREIFDPLEIQQERDERKRNYCKKHNIPLYELIYLKGKFKNLEILPFQFNDYPCKKEQGISD